MPNYSQFIMDAMAHVAEEIIKINPNSIDRFRLHNTIHRIIVANIYYLATLEDTQRRRTVEYIFKMKLVDELSQYMKQETQNLE